MPVGASISGKVFLIIGCTIHSVPIINLFCMAGKTYAHNFWLDIYRVAGILPFIFSISATIDEIIILFRFGRLHTDRSISPIAFCFTSAAIINFMVEPIYIANPYIYYFFLMIQGGINGAMHQSKSEVTHEPHFSLQFL